MLEIRKIYYGPANFKLYLHIIPNNNIGKEFNLPYVDMKEINESVEQTGHHVLCLSTKTILGFKSECFGGAQGHLCPPPKFGIGVHVPPCAPRRSAPAI